jgi:hypothetical protein
MAVLDDKNNDGHRWKTAVEKHSNQLPAKRYNISDLPYELHTVSMTEKTSSNGLKSARALMLVLLIWAFNGATRHHKKQLLPSWGIIVY